MRIITIRYKLKLVLLFFIIYAVPTISFAQSSNTSSPYSRYGIGDLTGKGFAQSFAMGGSHIAFQNDSTQLTYFINPGNPASYASSRLTSADLGLNYSLVQLGNTSSKQTVHNAALANVAMAFPVQKWWGTSIGLLPYSSVGYAISDYRDLSNVGNVEYLYEGNGGINQLYFGNAVKPLYFLPYAFLKSKKHARLLTENNRKEIERIVLRKKRIGSRLSLGFNASYLFGNMENSKRSNFQPEVVAFNTRSTTSTRVSDVSFDYGMQYAHTIDTLKGRDLKDNVQLILGATFSGQTKVNAKVDTLTYNYYYGSNGEEIVRDTVKLTNDTKGSVVFPLSFGFGIGFRKGLRWTAGADFSMQNWSSYQAFNQSQSLKNSMRISAGVQYIPNPRTLKGYHKRVQYRMGGRFAKTALELKGTQLNEYALSLGAGLPVSRGFSLINIGVEIGQRGTISNGLIREDFMKVSIGFTLSDYWFAKARID
jgi:hypothetical protein